MGIIKLYLVLYNIMSALGWAYILYLSFESYQNKESPDQLWSKIEIYLTYVQTAACMEVIHSLIGFVRSPFMTALMQVSSRILLVWGYTRSFVGCQNHYSLYLMTLSWALVEVPRYLFYVFTTLKMEVPFPLFWLRYSLFMILYPSGISGELLQMYTSLKESSEIWHRFTIVMMILYIPAGPFMINNMWRNRKRAFKKRSAPKRVPSGLVWPITNTKTEERSSSRTNKEIFAASIGAIDQKEQQKVDKERNWRFGYAKHLERNVQISLQSSDNALAIANGGLKAAHSKFQFIRNGRVTSLAEAMKNYQDSFETAEISGKKSKNSNAVIEVPYGGRDPTKPYYLYRKNKDVLSGNKLEEQLDKWVAYGTIEKSAADGIRAVVRNKDWVDLSNHYFILLGATSAMGPLDILLKYGANVIAIDIDRDHVWDLLEKKARESCGRLIYPVQKNGKRGANLLEHTPEICNWLQEVTHDKKNVTIGNYTYLDGALHVQLSIACDAIISGVCDANKNASVAFLCTPTDFHVIPKEAHDASIKNREASPWWMKLISSLSKKMLIRNDVKPVTTTNGERIYYVNGISIAQGPNYALAKRIQHWRAIVELNNGHRISSNIAPSTATKSVVHAFLFKAAYGGFHLFKPLEVMYQETSNAVMGALLISDVIGKKSKMIEDLSNPYQLFEYGSFHGGVWRSGYRLDSIGEVAVMSYFWDTYKGTIIGAIAMIIAICRYVLYGGIN